MSDKSFGDHINKGIVKNPLLSSAVTGVSLEDLTYKAVLLPATPTQGQVTRLDQQLGSQSRTLAKPNDDKPGFPSGDAFSNIPLSNTPTNRLPNVLDEKHTTRGTASATESKASVKSEDDFDVNEYIARLQGTRYVSAPLHSHKKEDQNANLDAEECLEEINLNESGTIDKNNPAEVQQSLTADIAQNFSQLPMVLPHVASAVFSSFSNMLNMNKSREQTPDEAKASGYQEVQFERPDVGVPLMGVEEAPPKDIGLPPKEPPISSINNYRITSKKKYAQIPGLSSGANMPFSAQNMPYNAQNVSYNAPIQQVIAPFFTPDNFNPTNVSGSNEMRGGESTDNEYVPSLFAPAEEKIESNANTTGSTNSNTCQIADTSSHMFNPEASNNLSGVQNSGYNANTEKDDKTVLFDKAKAEMVQAHENRPIFSPVDNKQGAPQSIPTPGPPIIPPPPMFSNIPRKDNQSSVGKSVLPPSVARRISSNQPLIKSQALPPSSFTENIFVPLAVPETSDQISVNQGMIPPALPQSITFKSDQSVKPPNIQPSQDNVAIPVNQNPGMFPSPPQSRITQPDYVTRSLFMPPKQEVPQSAFEIVGRDSIPPPQTSVISSALQPSSIPPSCQFKLDTASSSSLPVVTTPSFVPMFNMTSQNVPLPSVFPSQGHSTQDMLYPITQYPPDVIPEPAKPTEPPKAIGNLNYRMTKKRPQYYSGPIEGIGDISNYVKPKIQPVMPPALTVDQVASNKAALFTPEQQSQTTAINEQSSIPFDISRPVDPTPQQVPIEPKPQQHYTHIEPYKSEPYVVEEYNTAFDLSRPSTETLDPPKQESKGFGIIGSLKSKLSSIDINKIQSTVTTFFDPAYNESKVEPAQADVPFLPQQYGQHTQEQSNFEVTIPGAEHSQYHQFGYQNVGYNYDQNNQYYQTQNTYASSYFSDPNYVQKSYDDPSLNKNTQESIPTNYARENIPQNVENIRSTGEESRPLTTFYNPATIQEHNALKVEADKNNSGLSYDKAMDNTQAGSEQAYKHLVNPLVETSNFLENPLVTSVESKIKAIGEGARKPSINVQAYKSHGKKAFDTPLAPAISFFDNPIASAIDPITKTDDIVDNMNKLALAEEIAIANSPFQAVDFAIGVIVQPKVLETSSVLSKVVGEKIINTPAYESIGSNTAVESKHTKGSSLMETLTKSDIPVVAVSSLPLFGLSAVIADKSKELLNEAKDHKCLPLLDTGNDSKPCLEKQASFSFFDDVTQDKNIHEESVKTTNKTHLSITDVKNVLLIEPPQENLGTILKRNASSSLLKDLPEASKGEHNLSEDRDSSWNLDAAIVTSKHNVNVSFDKKGSGFFDHLIPFDNSTLGIVQSKNMETIEKESDFNICETCREVNVPEDKETDNVTTQLIENINSSIQLTNPVEASLTERDPSPDKAFDEANHMISDINQITENTFDTLQAQSATNLLEDVTKSSNNYDWTTEELAYSSIAAIDKDFGIASSAADYGFHVENKTNKAGGEYTFKIDPNTIGFFGNNQLFFDNVPKNASDELKAEFKTSHDDIVLPKQMSLPSAPPAEEDTKSDEIGLDVHSIEQDAKNDFPIEEEFIIEPSETDDGKIEFRESKRSSDDSVNDTFTDRIDKFKNKVGADSSENIFEQKSVQTNFVDAVPPKSMASYFDTGNYAVETHYRNSLTSPTLIDAFRQGSSLRIPPGFEDEYKRRLSAYSSSLTENVEPYIPETSTQTRTTLTPTFASGHEDEIIVTSTVQPIKEPEASHVTSSVQAFFSAHNPKEDQTDVIAQMQSPPKAVEQKIIQETVPLQDPINFFSSNTEEPKPATSEAPESFSRLASYFSMPPAQPDHSKSFFELSQSQNHYRHEKPDTVQSQPHVDQNLNITQTHNIDHQMNSLQNLMADLTSTLNMNNDDNIVTTVNYFSVAYDGVSLTNLDNLNLRTTSKNNVGPLDSSFVENNKVIDSSFDCGNAEDEDIVIVKKCEYCCNKKVIDTKDFVVRTAVNNTDTTKPSERNMNDKEGNEKKTSVSVDLGLGNDLDKEANDGNTGLQEGRTSSEYTPVRHHWFYRVDVDDKSLWRGFSAVDSNALERAYLSPDLTEDTLVPTDGGRFDVNVVGRLRIAVYWKEKPTNVRRCSWFYKGNTDARYVPYTEAVADKLEEEYRRGVTTGEWHRRLVLPNSELVVMHGPAVMVHFLHGAADSFSSPPFLLGKRVYRNPPKIRVARDLPLAIDHLIFMVHGAGEYKRDDSPSTSRPRVVRRGHEESEIEDPEPSSIDHLLLLCHGVGSACDMRFRSVEEVVEDFRTTSLQLVQSHYRNSYDNGIVSRVEVLPISWHAQLHVGEDGVDKRLNRVTLDSIPRLRAFTNHTVLDALFYTSPVYHQTIIDTVCFELNRIYGLFKQRNPNFKGGVSLGGHSLGSVILYDLLCHQKPEGSKQSSAEKTYLPGTDERVKALKYPQLQFPPAALYALGSPIAIFECIRGVESLGMDFALPTCKNFFNIFHPYDPIAYRIEPLINPLLQDAKPFLIPHHKGRKRMHLELKDTMVRVGADLKQKLLESLRTTWNKWKSSPPQDGQLEKVVEEELEQEQLCEEVKEEEISEQMATPDMLGKLNNGRRVDYVLQEAPLEMINEYLFAMSSHVGYWESEDTMLLMLREIYSSLGVQPDSTVPQQSMTVERTTLQQDEATTVNENDYPSTSRGSC